MEEGGGEKREGKRLTLGLFNTVRGKCPLQRQTQSSGPLETYRDSEQRSEPRGLRNLSCTSRCFNN